MADVEFQDFSAKVKDAVDETALRFLEEAASEIESQAQRNSRVDTGQLKGSWNHRVNESAGEATVGSPEQNAIWEEFGKKFLCRTKIGQNRLSFMVKCAITCP